MTRAPGEMKRTQFTHSFRGYDTAEVDAWADEMTGSYGELLKNQTTLEQKIVELETQLKDFRSMEKALQQTFMQAQETSGKAIEQARREAQLIIHEAEAKGSQIIEKARHDLTTVREQLIIVKAKKDSIVSRLKMLLQSELELIKALEVDEELRGMDASGTDTTPEESKQRSEIDEIVKRLDL